MPKNDFTTKMIDFDTFTKMPKNVGDLGKLIAAKGFRKLPKVPQIGQFGHTGCSTFQEKPDLLSKHFCRKILVRCSNH